MQNNINEIREKVSSGNLLILKQSLVFFNEKISNERVRDNINEIREKVSSEDISVLKQSLVFLNEKISNERVRASKAETRAVATLAYSGVISGVVVVRLPNILHDFTFANWDCISPNLVLIFILYTATIIFLLKSAIFAFKALGVLKRNELTPDLVFDLLKMSEKDALREEITCKIWEYYELLPISSTRLLWVNRAQRNILASIFVFSVLGIIWILFEKIDLPVNNWFNIFLFFAMTVIIIAIFSLDFVIEKCNRFWN